MIVEKGLISQIPVLGIAISGVLEPREPVPSQISENLGTGYGRSGIGSVYQNFNIPNY